jgi:hypothetical protein
MNPNPNQNPHFLNENGIIVTKTSLTTPDQAFEFAKIKNIIRVTKLDPKKPGSRRLA